MRLLALTPLTYNTSPLAAGDAFEASERDGLMLIARRRAREDVREPAPAVDQAADDAPEDAETPVLTPKRARKAR